LIASDRRGALTIGGVIDIERAARIIRVDVDEAHDLANAIGARDLEDLSVAELEEMAELVAREEFEDGEDDEDEDDEEELDEE